MNQLFETVKELIECKHRENYNDIQRLFHAYDNDTKFEELFIQMQDNFINTSTPSKWNKEMASCYIQIALKLKEFVLCQIIIQEEGSLNTEQLCKLLHVEALHKSLIAVSLQLIIFSNAQEYNGLHMWIYQIFNIESFHIFNILDKFENVIFDFPTVILLHITAIEREIVEHSIWKLGSQIYPLFASSTSENSDLQSTKTENRFLSPLNVVQAFNSPISKISINPSRPKIISILLKKIYEIVYTKMKKIAQYINISALIEIEVRRCFEYCINFKTELFLNRHLDQILMCCIYGVCRIHCKNDEVSFKSIISAYRNIEPHKSPNMWKKMWMGESNYFDVENTDEVKAKQNSKKKDFIEINENEIKKSVAVQGKDESGINDEAEEEEEFSKGNFDSIIKFYNVIFIHHVKQHLLDTNSSPITSPKRKADIIQLSMDALSPNSRFIAGMRVMKMDKMSPNYLQHTPRTRKLYSFGNSPISSLKRLSPTRTVIGPTSNASKKLKFDSEN